MVLTTDSSDTARLIALRLHWIAAVLLALELACVACQTAPPALPTPTNPPASMPGDNDDADPAPRTSTMLIYGRSDCGWGRR